MALRLALSVALLACCTAVWLPAADQTMVASPAAVTAAAPAATVQPVWLTSYADAQAQAQKEKKIVLAAFVGSDWCPYCKKLEAEVFATPAFQTWAQPHFVLLNLDFPQDSAQDEATRKQNEALSEKFEVERFPTVLFIGNDGKELNRIGYKPGGPDKWIPAAEALVGQRWNAASATAIGATPATKASLATSATTPAANAAAAAMAAMCKSGLMDQPACEANGGGCTGMLKADKAESTGAMADCKMKAADGACAMKTADACAMKSATETEPQGAMAGCKMEAMEAKAAPLTKAAAADSGCGMQPAVAAEPQGAMAGCKAEAAKAAAPTTAAEPAAVETKPADSCCGGK